MSLIKVNKSYIFCENHVSCVNDYYQYIVSLLKSILINDELSINIILGNGNGNGNGDSIFNNKNKTLRIGINYEHTLVKKGGRSVPKKTPFGKVKYSKKNVYYVRIHGFQKLNSADIVIDYSNPNIYNVKTSTLFNDFSNKHIYIAPYIYKNIDTTPENRDIKMLTTFINVNEPRRKQLLCNIKTGGLEHTNINNCFDKIELQELYRNTKILINIHQTDHHDTFEELRVLPALQNGVLVVSEKSPLNHLIPYNNLIIWSDYDNIIDTVKEVLKNYVSIFSAIFTEKNSNILQNLNKKNIQNLETIIKNHKKKIENTDKVK
jgi:hypothetical protein